MLEKELLKDIGFVKGTGWDGEMWVFNGCFWVSYFDHDPGLLKDQHADGRKITRKRFFEKFISVIENEIMDRARVCF
jgi:hypothetical protein